MPRLALAMLALIVATALPARAEPAAVATITAFADAFDRAQLAQDEASLGRMIADDLVFIDGSGRRQGKKEFIAGWTTPGDRYEPIILVDRQIISLGVDGAIVSAETTLKGVSGGKPFSSRFRFADTFRRVDGRWQAVHIQVTRIP